MSSVGTPLYTTETLQELIDQLAAGTITQAEYTSKIGRLPPTNQQPDFSSGTQIDLAGNAVPDYYDNWDPTVNYWEGFEQPPLGGFGPSVGAVISDPSGNYYDFLSGLANGIPLPGAPGGIAPPLPPGGNAPAEPPVSAEPPSSGGVTTGDLSPEQRSVYERLIGLGLGAAVAVELARNPNFSVDATATPDVPQGTEVNQPPSAPIDPSTIPSPSPPPDVHIPPGGIPNFPIDVIGNPPPPGGGGIPGLPIVPPGLPANPPLPTGGGPSIGGPGESPGHDFFPWIPVPPGPPNGPTTGGPGDPTGGFPPIIPGLPGLPGLPGQQPQPQITNNNSLALGAGNFPELQYPEVPVLPPVGGQIYANPFPFQMIRR